MSLPVKALGPDQLCKLFPALAPFSPAASRSGRVIEELEEIDDYFTVTRRPSERVVEFILELKDLPGVCFLTPATVLVRPNAALYERWDSFHLNSNEYWRWSSSDGRNTLPVRLLRCFVGDQANHNPHFCTDAVVSENLLRDVSFDNRAVANELFNPLTAPFARAGSPAKLGHRLAALAGEAAGPSSDPRELSRTVCSDKHRQQLVELLLAGLRLLHGTIADRPVEASDRSGCERACSEVIAGA